MATVFQIMKLYRRMTELLKPLEGLFGGAWQSLWAGGLRMLGRTENTPDLPGGFGSDFKRNFKISGGGRGGMTAFRTAFGDSAASGGSGGFMSRNIAGLHNTVESSGLGAFNFASRLSGNGSFFYTGFGGNSAVGQRGLDTFPEKIRGGNEGFRSAGGTSVLPDNGSRLGMVLDKQFVSKKNSGAVGIDGGYSGEYGNYGTSGENRGLLYSDRTLRAFENPGNGLAPIARIEDYNVWKGTEHLRFNINDDAGNGTRLSAIRGYAGHEADSFGGSEVHIDMSSMKNIVNNGNDMDELIDRLCGAIGEAAFSMAEGVHY